jgi:KUP system potassium uptake protein
MKTTQLNLPHTSTLKPQSMAVVTLAAIGVVYGDIGTSPLYTMKEIFAPATGIALNPSNLIGAVSVVLWALMLIVTLKYVLLILRADNKGEGGSLALTALAANAVRDRPALRKALLLLGVFGATLFYGDSVITPAISVLGAVEGLEILTPLLKPYVVPISITIIICLFFVQRFGTQVMGRFFGPVIVAWFGVLAVTGVLQISQEPSILAAFNPIFAWNFLIERGWKVFAAVGAIVLALTGAEALYADMGHFGRKPIQIAWLGLVLPGLTLNYMGQGALLIRDPSALENPFYRMFPEAWLIPALILATLAAIIASQAVISGAYSMTKQAIQLGFFPRLRIFNTFETEAGQIYVPAANWALMVGVVIAMVGFGSSSALAGAYGIAVTLTMFITTILTYFVIRPGWHLPAPLAIGATAFFLSIDALLVAGCIVKFFDGGWFPLALGLLIFTAMSTWNKGRAIVVQNIQKEGLSLEQFIGSISLNEIHRATRTAIYPVANPDLTPLALLHNLKHNQVLHEKNIILNVKFAEVPWVSNGDRVSVESIGHQFWKVKLTFGFMDTPDVPQALALCAQHKLPIDLFETTYFLSRETVGNLPGSGMSHWRRKLFAAMSRNADGVVGFFKLPDNAVVELGTRIQV